MQITTRKLILAQKFNDELIVLMWELLAINNTLEALK
jgi:hypothetical protein